MAESIMLDKAKDFAVDLILYRKNARENCKGVLL